MRETLNQLNLSKRKRAAYRATLDLEIKFLNYNLEPLSENYHERRIQNYFRNGRDIKRLMFLCLTRSTLISNGITAKSLINLTQSSRSYINDRLSEIMNEGWADRYADKSVYRYFATKLLFQTWIKRYEIIFEDFGKDSVLPNFLNHMVVSWGLFHIEQETNVTIDDITEISHSNHPKVP